MNFSESIILSLIIIIILLLITIFRPSNTFQTTEGFDTYHFHDTGASEVYGIKNLKDAELLARYDWSTRDPDGMSLYDKVYENNLINIDKSNPDKEYSYRDINSTGENNVYDWKFVNWRDDPSLTYSQNDFMAMVDQNPATVYDFHSGETEPISQKNY